MVFHRGIFQNNQSTVFPCFPFTHNRPAMPFGNTTFILEDHFSAVLLHLKKYRTSGNVTFNYLGIFQSLRLRISMGKILKISLKLNFTPNTLGCYVLIPKTGVGFYCEFNAKSLELSS